MVKKDKKVSVSELLNEKKEPEQVKDTVVSEVLPKIEVKTNPNDKILEVYGFKGELVKSFSIKDGEDYIEKGMKFALDNSYSIGFVVR